MNLMIPKRELINEFLKNTGKLKKDKLMYVLHIIRMGVIDDRNCYGTEGATFVRLNSTLLKKNLGNGYKAYLDFWVDRGVLAENEKYSSGNFSKSYSLSPDYNEFEWYTITDFTFKRTLERARRQKVYPYLGRWIDQLEIDREGAIKEAEALKDEDPKYQRCLYSIESFGEKETIFKVDSSGFRLHTKLTGCPKILRKFITIKGNHLVEVDMSNCQFYLLLYLMNKEVWRKKNTKRVFRGYDTYLGKYISNMYTIIDRIHDSGEFGAYKKLVISGGIYDYFLRLIQEKSPRSTRDEVKKLLMLTLFSPNEMQCSGMKTIFKSKFSTIYTFIEYLKSNIYDSYEERHSVMAILLQRLESHVILDKVTRRINKERPRLPVFTIHDCLVTTTGNEAYLKEVLIDECFKLIGAPPTTKTVQWQPQESKVISMQLGNIQVA